MEIESILTKGGPLLYVLLSMSVIGLAITLLKLYQFWRIRERDQDLLQRVLAEIASGRAEQALDRLKMQAHNPVARVLETAVRGYYKRDLREDCLEKEIARVGTREVRSLEEWLRPLGSVAQLSPLVGLLGTVLGMISAFISLEGAGNQVNPALLAGGIWEALLTTAVGLAIAIPAMAAYHYLEGRVDQIKSDMQDAVTAVLVTVRNPASSQRAKVLEMREA